MNASDAFQLTGTLAAYFATAYLVTITAVDYVPARPPRLYIEVNPVQSPDLVVPYPWGAFLLAIVGGIIFGIALVERRRPTGHLQSAE